VCTNSVLIGIGNLYKAEVCFLLGVSPWSPVSAVDPAAAVRLCRRLLLRNAEHPEQSTTGELRHGAQHWVYGRAGRACRRCGGTVRAAAQGSSPRTAYWCPHCQPGPYPGGRSV
jgi:endonuclease-8